MTSRMRTVVQSMLGVGAACTLLLASARFPDDAPHPAPPAARADLDVVVEGMSSAVGSVRVAVYSEREQALFPTQAPPLTRRQAASEQPVVFHFRGLAAGRYAIVAFQDENDNDLLDRSLFGIPREPWGVSGTRPSGRAPRYGESSFVLAQARETVTIHLE